MVVGQLGRGVSRRAATIVCRRAFIVHCCGSGQGPGRRVLTAVRAEWGDKKGGWQLTYSTRQDGGRRDGDGGDTSHILSPWRTGMRWWRFLSSAASPAPRSQGEEAGGEAGKGDERKEQTSSTAGGPRGPISQVERSQKTVMLALGGNVVITTAKLLAWYHSGSSAMLSESIHSLVDCGNQALLLIGLRAAVSAPDRHHQYGYGKSIYFWSLVSALGTFWLGAGVSLRNSFQDLFNPTVQLETINADVWGVLALSFVIDGSVLHQSIKSFKAGMPKGANFFEHLWKTRDPTTLAVMLEDGGACLGVVMAIVGIGLSQYTGSPMFDSIGGVAISTLLAGMGLTLARLNERYLLGQAVEPEIVDGIRQLLLNRPGIDSVQSVQSQWIGPYTFAYKAEVDFDGTYLAAKLMARYEDEFLGSPDLKHDLPVLLAFYAEDVVRTLEREVREVEREIRAIYPEAQFIELEPASKDTTSFAIDGHREKILRELEELALSQLIYKLAKSVAEKKPTPVPQNASSAPEDKDPERTGSR